MTKPHLAGHIAPRIHAALLGVVSVALIVAGSQAARAQSAPMVYPSQGQSLQQQAQDEGLCRNWAQQQTGFNPMQGPAQVSSGSPQGGQAVRGAARGATLGAVGGAIGGDAGKGAAIGAGVGAAAGLMRKRQQNQAAHQAQSQANAQYQQQLANYNRGFATCMQGRGYAVN